MWPHIYYYSNSQGFSAKSACAVVCASAIDLSCIASLVSGDRQTGQVLCYVRKHEIEKNK